MSETAKKKGFARYPGHSRLSKSGKSGSLSVPGDMMSILTEGLLFKPELTKDGILFKIVDESKIATEDKTVPAWVKKATTSTRSGSGSNVPETGTSPIPPVDDDHPDSDGSDESEVGDFEPPVTDDDTPF